MEEPVTEVQYVKLNENSGKKSLDANNQVLTPRTEQSDPDALNKEN